MSSYYSECEGIPEYIIKLEKACNILVRASLPMLDKQLLTIASASVFASQDFPRATEDWERQLPVAKHGQRGRLHSIVSIKNAPVSSNCKEVVTLAQLTQQGSPTKLPLALILTWMDWPTQPRKTHSN